MKPSESERGLLRYVKLRSATALVIANMIGAGIFTTTGFHAADLGHPGTIFLLWIVGGLLAFSGAVCYAELGASMPRAGGEYVYLRNTYGGAVGFMSAFVSLIAGFSAPIAAEAGLISRALTCAVGRLVPLPDAPGPVCRAAPLPRQNRVSGPARAARRR